MRVAPFTLWGIYLPQPSEERTQVSFSCSNCHQKLLYSQNLTILRLLVSPLSLVLPRSQAVQTRNFTLPEEVHTYISHHLVPAHQCIHISFHQDSALIFYFLPSLYFVILIFIILIFYYVSNCPSLAMLCLFAPLAGHSKSIICTFQGRKFRGKKEKGVTVQKLSQQKLNQGNTYKRECGTVCDDSLLLWRLCTAWGFCITLLLSSWDTHSAFQVSELGKAISSSPCFLCNVIESIIPFVISFCVCFALQ